MNCRTVSAGRLGVSTVLLLFIFFLSTASALSQEFRALWADTFHAGMRNSAEVSQMVADARAGNFNAVIVEVRKRGDAYYNSNFEPKATDVSPQSFDPLADLVAKAHNTSNGPRIEVHAWIVTYNIWNNETTLPPQTTHPYRLHPDWVTRSSSGETWDGSNYAFDPGHPEVQKHTFSVAMDIVSRYNVDGLHFDYIRYAGNTWGYNDASVNRFKARFNRAGTPSATDPQWLQFRRDQVTSLVRKIYLSAIAQNPLVKISAATITWAPGITTDAQWPSSAAYSSVLQDWRAWMQEGILDLNVPMAYFRQPVNGTDWANWSIFAKNHRYNRHLSIGSGIYLNSVSDGLAQMRSTRTTTSTGNRADGVTGYSYAVTSNDGVPRSTFFSALTQPSAYDPDPTSIFSTPTTTPAMPWKTAPTLGHLKGIVTRATTGAGIDGAGLALSGAANRALLTDATGFYGAVDLPPGNYTLTASFTNLEPKTVQVTITAGAVANQDFNLALPPGAGFFSNVLVSPGARGAIVTWNTTAPTMSQVEFGTSTNYGGATHLDENLATNHSMLLPDLIPNTNYFFRLVARTETNELRSSSFFFQTAGELIVDNPAASFTGGWTIATSSTDKYSTNYHYAGTVTGGATATAAFTPNIATPGKYDVYVWYPQGGNRSTNAPFLATYNGGSLTARVDQTTGGGTWQLIASNRRFSSGTGGYVRLSNDTGESGKIVLADAVRFVYAANQEPPPPGTVPEWWATHYFGSNVNGLADHDGDGLSAYAEFVMGTAPDDADSRLQLGLDTDAQGNRLAIFSPQHPGRLYRLQSRTDVGTTNWTTLTNLTLQTNSVGEGVITDTNAPGTQKYYRLQIELVP
jgi:uncharacterized lipoprotein YddW (UPF0748 family)